MTDAPPIQVEWSGEAFFPATPYQQRVCDKYFVVGQRYTLVELHERSSASHKHYYACVREAWMNLPDALLEQNPTEDILRKRALIMTGYCHRKDNPCASRAEARRTAEALMAVGGEFAIVTVVGNVVTRMWAMSQNYRSMDKAQFQASKDAVLDWIAAQIQTTREELEKAAA